MAPLRFFRRLQLLFFFLFLFYLFYIQNTPVQSNAAAAVEGRLAQAVQQCILLVGSIAVAVAEVETENMDIAVADK